MQQLPPLPLSLPLCLQLEVGLRVAMHQRAVSMFVPKIKSMCPVLCAASERASLQLCVCLCLCVCVEIYNRKSATVKKQCCAKRAARATLSVSLSHSLSVALSVGFAAVACRGEPAAAPALCCPKLGNVLTFYMAHR